MDDFANRPARDRADVFLTSAAQRGVERTFWEKATLLHEIAHRADADPPVWPAPRLSRHYYDLATLADQPIGRNALTRIGLLHEVAQHKATFFPRKAAHVELATPGTLRLLPSFEATTRLQGDYADMRPMFFADPPPVDVVIDRIRRLESTINALAPRTSSAKRPASASEESA